MSTEKNEIMATEASTYLTDPVNLNELFSEELDGLRPSFERIKIPAGGGISYSIQQQMHIRIYDTKQRQ